MRDSQDIQLMIYVSGAVKICKKRVQYEGEIHKKENIALVPNFPYSGLLIWTDKFNNL